jgi:hypothetical protein
LSVHSKFGGSVAARYMACPGSVTLVSTLPNPSSAAADEGTWAHAIGAYCLEQDIRDARMLVHQSLPFGVEVPDGYFGKIVDSDTATAVNVYLDAVFAELDKTDDAELYIEEGFELNVDCAPGEVFGTNDAMVYHPSLRRLVVFDYKHGRGVSVVAEENAQLQFYAAGAVFGRDWEVSELELVIVQPRAAGDGLDPVRAWPMPVFQLLEFLGDVQDAIAKAKAPDAPFVAGVHCDKTFCPARGTGSCPAYTGRALEAAKVDYADVVGFKPSEAPDPKSFDAEALGQLLAALPLFTDWLNQVQQYAEALMLSGVEIPGFKVVDKLGRRKWVAGDEEVAGHASMLFDVPDDVMRPRKLVTLTEAEKVLKGAGATKEQIDDFMLKYTIKESSGRTIAPASDKRPAVDAVAADFSGVTV